MTPIRGEHASGLLLHHFVRNNLVDTLIPAATLAKVLADKATVYIIDTVLMPPPPDRTSRLR